MNTTTAPAPENATARPAGCDVLIADDSGQCRDILRALLRTFTEGLAVRGRPHLQHQLAEVGAREQLEQRVGEVLATAFRLRTTMSSRLFMRPSFR
jgi:hypothetical protein